MMSNSLRPLAGFWSVSGELRALYWGPVGHSPDPLPPGLRKPGVLVPLTSESLEGHLPPASPGWHFLFAAPPRKAEPKKRRRSRKTKAIPAVGPRTDAPATAPTLAMDHWPRKFLPARFVHEQFVFTAMPTWIASPRVNPDESPEGWVAVLNKTTGKSLFLVRIPPRRGKLPGPGWRNILSFVLRSQWDAKLVAIPQLPSPEVLAQSVSWEFRVDAGPSENDQATWDLQILPSRGLLASWVGRACGPWEATAQLRWLRPGVLPSPIEGVLTWRTLFTHLAASDVRLLVQNVLMTGYDGAASVADVLFSIGLDGKPRPRKDLPLAWLSTLFPRRQWAEIERASRALPVGDPEPRRALLLGDIEEKLASGALLWSPRALELWELGYRQPRRAALLNELEALSSGFDWKAWYQNPPLVLEGVLRNLDVTDAALCLETAPDARWRRHVTRRREVELRAEAEFCRQWRSRGELTVERELDAWQSFLEETRKLATMLTPL